jgi:DNA-binding transcriptional regulator YiaG
MDAGIRSGYRSKVRRIATDLEQLFESIIRRIPESERSQASVILAELHDIAFGPMSNKQFKRLRLEKGLSQESFARLSGRTLRQIARYEAGTSAIPAAVANLLMTLEMILVVF